LAMSSPSNADDNGAKTARESSRSFSGGSYGAGRDGLLRSNLSYAK
jgi:hypothetical protein